LEEKRGYENGETIQFLLDSETNEWEDIKEPDWNSVVKYRIKPEEPKSVRMTYRQMAEWAIKQNGEIKSPADPGYVFCDLSYREDLENKEVPEGYKLRRWGSDEWIEPTYCVFARDCLNK
jgi:hypothetical protein